MHASIWVKFSTQIWGVKANTCIKIGVNLFIIQGVISDLMHKTKLNFCQAYRLNYFEEQAENRYIARLNNRRVHFVVKNQSSKRQQRYEA